MVGGFWINFDGSLQVIEKAVRYLDKILCMRQVRSCLANLVCEICNDKISNKIWGIVHHIASNQMYAVQDLKF